MNPMLYVVLSVLADAISLLFLIGGVEYLFWKIGSKK